MTLMDLTSGMNSSRSQYRSIAVWLGLMSAICTGATAQEVTLTLTNTPSPVKLEGPVVYSLVISNNRPENLPPGRLISVFPTTAQVSQATNSQGGAISTNTPGQVVCEIPDFSSGAVLRFGLTIRPTQAGSLTNTFTVTTPVSGSPLLQISTNAIIEVALPEADVAVSVSPPPAGVFVGDTGSWQLLATNGGPDAATGVVVTNPLPPGVSFISGSPSGQVSLVNTQILFTVGALSNGGSAEATVNVLANAAGNNLLSATIGATNSVDPNPTNSSFTTNLVILAPDTNILKCGLVSTQRFEPQTGLMEQRIAVTNTGSSAVDAFRVSVEGLTNALMNASGTNNGMPFVSHGAALAASNSIELVLEYFNPTRQPGADPVLTAYPTPTPDLTPRTGTGVPISSLVLYEDGTTLIEFESAPGAHYQVLYASELGNNTFLGSLPEVTAVANRTQWIDYGPPRTTSQPSDAPARFYQVIQLP